MPIENKKIKIYIFPNFSFETVIATFIDLKKFEIVFGEANYHELEAEYSGNLYGDWCYPLKFLVAVCAEAVQKNKAQKIIGLNANVCSYPFLVSGLKEWVRGDYEVFLISMNKLGLSRGFIYYYYLGLKKALGLNFLRYIIKVPLALYRLYYSEKIYHYYLKNLPLVKSSRAYKNLFNDYRKKFVLARGFGESKKVFSGFINISDELKVQESPKGSLVVSGDFSVLLLEFLLFDLDVYLAQKGIEVIQTFSAISSPALRRYGASARQSWRLLGKYFSSSNYRSRADKKHLIEAITLAQIIKGGESAPDGIIFFKPIMCTPCENVSRVLKRENYFNFPTVEVSYDEHSGLNGVMTRLEAFLNLVYDDKLGKNK
jgi:hypothetical protein